MARRGWTLAKPPSGVPVQYGHPLAPHAGWLFAEGAGARTAELTGRYPPTAANLINGTAWQGGPHGSALFFDGADDYVVARTAPILAGYSDWSIVAWVRTGAAYNPLGGRAIYCERASSGNDILKLDSLDDISRTQALITYRNDGGNLLQVRGSRTINDNRVHQIAATKSDSLMRLWVDGALDATGTWVHNNTLTDTIHARIGGDPGDALADWSDLISSVLLYRRDIGAAGVAALYAQPYGFLDRPVWLRAAAAAAGDAVPVCWAQYRTRRTA
jgi:hypothetical protein